MTDRIQVNRHGSIDFNVHGGSGKTGQIKKGSLLGRTIRVDVTQYEGGTPVTTPLILNKGSLIDFLNAQGGAKKLKKSFLWFKGSDDDKVKTAFLKAINNANKKPLNVSQKLFEEVQEQAKQTLRQKLKEQGNGDADNMDSLDLIRGYVNEINTKPFRVPNSEDYKTIFVKKIEDEVKIPIATLLVSEAWKNKEENDGEEELESMNNWIEDQFRSSQSNTRERDTAIFAGVLPQHANEIKGEALRIAQHYF